MSIQSDIYRRSLGFDSQTSTSLTPEIDHLLSVAQAHGGSVAQVATEIAHPNASILTYVKDKLGGAFTGIMDTLMLPSNAVASIASQFTSEPISYAKAREQRITPADIIFGEPNKDAGFISKAGMFTARLATDILFDPLTYVTFGTSSGLLGISKLTSIPIKEQTARQLGLKVTEVAVGGKVVKEALRHRALSKEGLEQLNTITSGIEARIIEDTVTSFYTDKNVANRLANLTERFKGKTAEEIDQIIQPKLGGEVVSRGGRDINVITKESTVGAEFILAEEYKKIPSLLGDLQGPARATKEEALGVMAMNNAMAEQANRLARHTLMARRKDIDDEAKKLISNLIERNVERGGVVLDKFGRQVKDQTGALMTRNLAREWIDRGGIKAFGKVMLAGQHIRHIGMMVPGLSAVDRATLGTRSVLASLFSTKWTVEGRAPDTVIQLAQRARNREDVATAELLAAIPKLYEKLGITKEEDKLISEAIVLDLPPASGFADKRLESLWTLLHSAEGQDVAREIVAGKYGDDVARMWQAAGAINKQLRSNLVLMHESGIATYPSKNYLPGVTMPQKKLLNPFAKLRTAKAVNAEKAELVKFRNLDNPEDVFYGSEDIARNAKGETVSLERLSKLEEKRRLEKEIVDNVIKTKEKKLAIDSEIKELWEAVQKRMTDNVFKESRKAFQGLAKGVDKDEDIANIKALYEAVREVIPDVKKEQLLKVHAEKRYEDGRKLMESRQLTGEDIVSAKEKLSKIDDEDLRELANKLINNMSKFAVRVDKAAKKPLGKEIDGDQDIYEDIINMVKEGAQDTRKDYLKYLLENDDAFMGTMRGIADKWNKNPAGVSRTIEKILGKEFEMRQLMDDLTDTIRGLQMELKGNGLMKVADRWFYKDKEGQLFERVRATAKEINENLFNSEEIFTESALRSALMGSLTAIRSSVSKQFLDDVVSKFGVEAGNQPSDFVRVSVDGLGKKADEIKDIFPSEGNEIVFKNAQGKEIFFHPTVAEYMVNALKVMNEDPASSLIGDAFDRFTRLWKASVTSIWPSFHGRNAISNVLQHAMDIGLESLRPSNHIMAAQMTKWGRDIERLGLEVAEGNMESMKKLIELEKKEVLTDAKGYTWSVGDLFRVIKDNVVAYNPNLVGMMDVRRTPKELIDAMGPKLFDQPNKWGGDKLDWVKPLSVDFKPFRYGVAVGNLVESQSRLVDFLVNLRKTGDVEHAAYQTKQFLFDYQNLTHFERNVARRVIPFWAFTRKNMELQTQTLLTKPGRVAAQFTAVRTIGDVFGGGSLTDEERDQLPGWMQEAHALVLDRQGSNITTMSTLGTPLEQPLAQLGNPIGAFNPLIKVPIEFQTGYSFFHGRPLSQVTDATAFSGKYMPPLFKDFIGYTEYTYTDKQGGEHTLNVALKPRNMHILSALPFTGRTLSTLKLIETDRIDTQVKWFQGAFGMKPSEIDLELEGERRAKELKEQIEQVLDDAGLGYRFDRFILSDDK